MLTPASCSTLRGIGFAVLVCFLLSLSTFSDARRVLQNGNSFPDGLLVGWNDSCAEESDNGRVRFNNESNTLEVCADGIWSSPLNLSSEISDLRERISALENESSSATSNRLQRIAMCNLHGIFDDSVFLCQCNCDGTLGCWSSLFACTTCSNGWTGDDCRTDVEAPSILLLGGDVITVEVSDTEPYVDPGVEILDNRDGDISSLAVVDDSQVDRGTPGTYSVFVDITDEYGNSASATRQVVMVDTTQPGISLLGDPTLTWEAGDAYVDAGVVVSDNAAAEPTLSVLHELPEGHASVVDPVEVVLTVVGRHVLFYSAVDASGNEAVVVNRTIDVIDTTSPQISAEDVVLWIGETYVEIHPIVTDNAWFDIPLKDSVGITASNVSTAAAGTYTVSYSVVDASGNVATGDRTVSVVEPGNPFEYLDGDARLIAWWRMKANAYGNSGTTIVNQGQGGSAYNGLLVGGAAVLQPRSDGGSWAGDNYGLTLGAGSYFEVPGVPMASHGAFTLTFWILYPTSNGATYTPSFHAWSSNTAVANRLYALDMDNRVRLYANGGYKGEFSQAKTSDSWQHWAYVHYGVAGTGDSQGVRFFKDGSFSQVVNYADTIDPELAGNGFRINARYDSSAPPTVLTTTLEIADLRIFGRSLNAEEVGGLNDATESAPCDSGCDFDGGLEAHYRFGLSINGTTSIPNHGHSGSSHDLNLVGSPVFTTLPNGQSFHGDSGALTVAPGQYFESPGNPMAGTNTWTVSFWLHYPTQNGNTYCPIIHSWGSSDQLALDAFGPDGMSLYVNGARRIILDTAVTDDDWQMWTIVSTGIPFSGRSGINRGLSFYRNGAWQQSVDYTVAMASVATDDGFRGNCRWDTPSSCGSSNCHLSYHDLRFYRTGLTPGAIRELYRATISPELEQAAVRPCPSCNLAFGLVAHYRFGPVMQAANVSGFGTETNNGTWSSLSTPNEGGGPATPMVAYNGASFKRLKYWSGVDGNDDGVAILPIGAYLEVDGPNVLGGLAQATISYWIYYPESNSPSTSCHSYHSWGDNRILAHDNYGSAGTNLYINGGLVGTYKKAKTRNRWQLWTWVHTGVGGTGYGQGVSFYLDGVWAESTSSFSSTLTGSATNQGFRMNSRWDVDGANSQHSLCRMDFADVRMYNRALSPQEVAELHRTSYGAPYIVDP